MGVKKAEQLEALSAAPKRQSQDPIYVNLVPPVLDGKMQRIEKPTGKEFTYDPIIKLVDDNQKAAGPLKLRVDPSVTDVEGSSNVSMRELLA